MNTYDLIIRILLAVALGGLIGLERELRDRAAGFRTHILVCVGAAAFTISSVYGFQGFMTTADASVVRLDPARIAAQIVTGIGFLGAGAIIRHGVSVRGLTTAASLWAVAAVGLAVGLGMYALSIVTTVTVVVSLSVLRFVEARFILPRAEDHIEIVIRFRGKGFGRLGQLVDRLEESQVRMLRLGVDPEDTEQNTIRLTLVLPPGMRSTELIRHISDLGEIEEVIAA